MSAFIYKATRALIAGHVLNTTYSIDVPTAKYDPNDIIKGSQQLSSNTAETIIESVVLGHKFLTVPLDWTNYLLAREFLLSAMDGQSIIFDISGTVAVPVSPLAGILKLQKSLLPSQSNNKLFQFKFEIFEFS